MTHDDFDPRERHALSAWPSVAPPPDLAQRVLQRLDTGVGEALDADRRPEPRGPGGAARGLRRPWTLAAATAAGVAGLGLLGWLVLAPQPHSHGALHAARRTTVQLERRAVIVAEAGALLSWQVDGSDATVTQAAGSAFYRVEHGGVFVVDTPRGVVRVLGTCFAVNVEAAEEHGSMGAKRASLAGAGVGAALATVVTISVYEGRVLMVGSSGTAEAGAGESLRLAADGRPHRAPSAGAATAATQAALRASGAEARALTPEQLRRDNVVLAQESKRLGLEVTRLQGALAAARKEAGKDRMLNLSKEELLELARNCELRWDMPPLGSDAPKRDDRAVDELGLDQAEQDAVNRALTKYHRGAVDTLRKLYIEVTGDRQGAETLSPDALADEIGDKSPAAESKAIYQRLANERAGLAVPPSDLSRTSAFERLMRLYLGAGDTAERLIGAELGPDLARRYREAHGGFGSRSRSRMGCP